MELQFKYNREKKYRSQAALIRSNSPAVWLACLSEWQVALSAIQCYILPVSLQNLEPSALFVVFSAGQAPPELNRNAEALGVVGERLFLPQFTEIFPPLKPEELNRLLLYPVQVYDPQLGLIGFEHADALNLSDLLSLEINDTINWQYAKPARQVWARLKQISITPPTEEEVLKAIKDEVEAKPLHEIPLEKKDKPTFLSPFTDPIKRFLFKSGLAMLKSLEGNAHAGTADSGPGWLHELHNWMQENLNDLENKRNAELNRLLNLFSENPEEALKYALPLNSSWANRGNSQPTGTLGKRSTNFNLGAIGRSGSGDNWDIGTDFYFKLRQQYQETAKREIEAGRHRKAAYIYAELLGDYRAAAQTLEEGKYYQEAATLYKEHLKNKPAAAACLEKGGLLPEAIGLYEELGNFEKAGDLYVTLDMAEQASLCYERQIDSLLNNKDHLDASRLIAEKLNQPERAKSQLLEGWRGTRQPEPCLKKYLEIAKQENAGALHLTVENIYEQETPQDRRKLFLEIVANLRNQLSEDEQFTQRTRELAYKIVSHEAAEGSYSTMHMLRHFLPDDNFVTSDCSRFLGRQKTTSFRKDFKDALQLPSDCSWLEVINHRNQILALGMRKKNLVLARLNWFGDSEYYTWVDFDKAGRYISALVSNPDYAEVVLIASDADQPMLTKNLNRNNKFDEKLTVGYPAKLPANPLAVAVGPESKIATLVTGTGLNKAVNLVIYNADGGLLSSVECHIDKKPFQLEEVSGLPMIYWMDKYYVAYGNSLFSINASGLTEEVLQSPEQIDALQSNGLFGNKILAVGAGNQVYLLSPTTTAIIEPNHTAGPRLRAKNGLAFISENQLVVISENEAAVYDISSGNPDLIASFRTPKAIIGILNGFKRNQVAFAQADGRISTYSISEP